jgi:vacuolar protein sorting-associated protein 13A/C
MSGVTGVFTKPIEGAKSGGVGGFFVGATKGFAGLVAKPVSGVVDLVSKTG